MSTTNDREQTISTVGNGGSRRKNLVIVAVAAIFPLLVVFIASRWLRPAKQVKTDEAPLGAASTGTVKLLVEQQWLIRMKLALAEERTIARQITATGRVVPAANSQALVAPPVGGILSGRTLPRVGQRVARGQTIALVQQVATSAEQAQVRAAAASLNLENARLRSEEH